MKRAMIVVIAILIVCLPGISFSQDGRPSDDPELAQKTRWLQSYSKARRHMEQRKPLNEKELQLLGPALRSMLTGVKEAIENGDSETSQRMYAALKWLRSYSKAKRDAVTGRPLSSREMEHLDALMECLATYPVTKDQMEEKGPLTAKRLRKLETALTWLSSYPEAKRQEAQRRPLNKAERQQLDAQLRQIWESMRDSLVKGHIEQAVSYFGESSRDSYRKAFTRMTPQLRKKFAKDLEDIQLIKDKGRWMEYDIQLTKGNKKFSFMLIFEQDLDGKWWIRSF